MVDAMCRSIAWSRATSADEFLSANSAVALLDAVFRSRAGTGSGTPAAS